ncbi:MAG: hypothetical protein NTU60_02810 [Candidatus Aminicenantes bacterium]|nr:hypothetical protein [Candidatus Aminicenantes bacterium]
MKRSLRIGILNAVVVLSIIMNQSGEPPQPAAANVWEAVGPDGGYISGLAVNPQNNDEIFAVDNTYPAQIFRSWNSGQSWEKTGFIGDSLYDIDFHPSNPNILYALAGNGIYKTSNHGSTWTKVNFGAGGNGYLGRLGVSPANASILYAGGYLYENGKYSMAVFKSTNAGDSWSSMALTPFQSSAGFYDLTVSPLNADIVYACGYYSTPSADPGLSTAAVYYKIFKTTNGGTSWQDVTGSINATPYAVAVDPTNPAKVYVAAFGKIYRSSDGGQNWSPNTGYVYGYALAIDPVNPNVLYAGYAKACYRSSDGGVNWTQYTSVLAGTCTRLLRMGRPYRASSGASGDIFYASSAGIFKSRDGAVNWWESHSGMRATQIASLAIAGSTPNVLYAEARTNGFFKSTDYGSTWQRCPDFYSCDAVEKIAVHPNNPNDIYILAGG